MAGERTADKPQAEDGIGKKMAKGRYPNPQESSDWLDGPNPSASGSQPAASSGADNLPEISELRAQLQALRRTNTFMTAEIYELKQRQARQDEVEVLLADARSQITESNVRRKEMARVIGERDVLMNKLEDKLGKEMARVIGERDVLMNKLEDKLGDANSALDAASALNMKLQLDLKTSARELTASQSRRKEMVQVIRNRELKIERLAVELSQNVDRVTSLEQRLLRRSPSHVFARILGNIRRFFS